ncbi:DUF1963 domain-containing protein [Cohnella hashimotonis]|uniref:DUF1963 domain-containing protein n=1 Tax=Cohnella hashimotonis TaxID=2826895 RepID=A0ABT6TS85_9BACL|nr:DUF1963 domain-containing protein [Cohnella hashimotonis]MDI4649716.1 DUF1963 domain-containing protein [Cohnella hashimotonis]
MTERIPCQNVGCSATILPATALKTGGICMPCHQKKLAREREAYILQNRKDVDRYDGVTDPVEILKIMHAPRQYDPLVREIPYPKGAQELYHSLTAAQREQMETYAISLIEQEDFDQAETILLSLVCFTNERIERGLVALFRQEKYDPGILYKAAGPAIRDELIRLVQRDTDNRNHLLLALAWIGDEEVVQLFAKWRKSPPRWASDLYLPPEKYAHEAGWELDQEGRKRLLFHPACYHFEVCEEGSGEKEPARSAVAALQTDEQACPWCRGKLTVLLDFDLTAPIARFLKLSGQRLKIAACLHCNCYGTVFTKVTLDGGYSWSPLNIVPEYLPDTDPDEGIFSFPLRLSDRPRGTYEGAYWTLEAPASQIGGHPSWIQDADYPACPCCQETTTFIGQIDMEQAADSEGIYYAFLCRACLIAAVNYQQS